MKRTGRVHTTLGDLIVALTDETLRFVPEGRHAYGMVASIVAGMLIEGRNATMARPVANHRPTPQPKRPRDASVLRCVCLAAALSLSACMSTFEPRMTAGTLETPRLPTAKETKAGVEVSIEEYFSSHKSLRAFDADVGPSGVLPILVHVENKSSQDYRLERSAIRALLNGQPLANIQGLEAAETGALRNPAWNALVNTAAMGPLAIYFGVLAIAGSASQTQKVNRQIEHHFERMELEGRVVKPNETATGFVFFRTPTKKRNIENLMLDITLEPELLGDHTGKSLDYRFAVPTLGARP